MFDAFDWLVMVSAVLIGNALTLWVVYSLWVITRIEKNGGKPSDAPWSALLSGVFVGGLVVCAALLLKTAG